MAEWLKAHAWKACIPQGIQGSNPCLSAIRLLRRTLWGDRAGSVRMARIPGISFILASMAAFGGARAEAQGSAQFSQQPVVTYDEGAGYFHHVAALEVASKDEGGVTHDELVWPVRLLMAKSVAGKLTVQPPMSGLLRIGDRFVLFMPDVQDAEHPALKLPAAELTFQHDAGKDDASFPNKAIAFQFLSECRGCAPNAPAELNPAQLDAEYNCLGESLKNFKPIFAKLQAQMPRGVPAGTGKEASGVKILRDTRSPAKIAPLVVAGQMLKRVNPVYPPYAQAARVSGTVVLHAIISREGKIKELTVVSGPGLLQDAAADAVRQWVYKPYLLNGEPAEVDTTVSVNFILPTPKAAPGFSQR